MIKITISCIALMAMASVSFAATDSAGKLVYDNACKTCHAPNLAKGMHAPAAFDVKAWSAIMLIAKAKSGPDKRFKTPYDYLVHQVKLGKGLMQHHGLCLDSNINKAYCSNEAYIQAIKFMSKPKAVK